MPMVILMDDEYIEQKYNSIILSSRYSRLRCMQNIQILFRSCAGKKIMLQVLTLFNFKLKLFKVEIYPCLALLGLSANQNIV